MTCLIWATVSAKPQACEEKDSIPSQMAGARELIQRNEGWHQLADTFMIPGYSRNYILLADAAADTPVYCQLMAVPSEGKVHVVMTRGAHRVGRTHAVIAQACQFVRP